MSCATARRALSNSLSNSIRRPIIARSTAATLSRRCYAIDLTSIDGKWRKKWNESNVTTKGSENLADAKDNHYVLPMFPYPSGTLHLGHLRVYSIADVVARFRTMKGDKAMLPMGWDAFGLPAENAAIERGVAPEKWTTSNMAKMKEQLELMNGSWDWNRVGSNPFWETISALIRISGIVNLRSGLLQAYSEDFPDAPRTRPCVPG